MKSDTFWKSFWITTTLLTVLCVSASVFLFMQHIARVNASAVGVAYDPLKDPFEFSTEQGHFSLTNGAVYLDAFPLGLQQWNWDSNLDWHSNDQVHSGTGSLRINFLTAWAGMGVSGFSASRNTYSSISLAVYPDVTVGDLYIDTYDGNGVAQKRQSLGWYASGGALIPNQWQVVTVPLANLVGSSSSNSITAISISTTNPGVAYIDDVHFGTDNTPHTLWIQPQWQAGAPFNPFATSTPEGLPYKMSLSQDSFNNWFAYYGYFALANDSFRIGPQAPAYNDSLAVLRGGRSWGDYRISATINWGITSTFSLLARMTDSQNYASCAYSYYGQDVQIYSVRNGVSTNLGETPPLPIDHDSPWVGMKAAMTVQGNVVTCYSNGEKVLSAKIDEMSPNGTAGLEAWDKNQYASPHSITSYQVQSLLGE